MALAFNGTRRARQASCFWQACCGWSITCSVAKLLLGGGAGNTEVMYSDGGYTVDRERWVDGEAPALEAAP